MLSLYNVTTVVHTRLAETFLSMEFENNDNCSKLFAFTLALPRTARLTHLEMDLDNGCALASTVKGLEEAQDDFQRQVDLGKPAAIVTAYDLQNYQLQVSLPPVGSTLVVLRYEELLWQRLYRVQFQVPLYPGIAVKELFLSIVVRDPTSPVKNLQVEGLESSIRKLVRRRGLQQQKDDTSDLTSLHFHEVEVAEGSGVPRLVTASFEPGALPDEGILLSSRDCFTHLFNPTTFLSAIGPMPKKIVFVIDVSGSMSGAKINDAKSAFGTMIQTLDDQDTVTVQTFSSQGTKALWGPRMATTSAKKSAVGFVTALSTGGSTNLREAYVDGIDRVYETEEGQVSVLVILTDGIGNTGPRATAQEIREINYNGKVKIYGFAFGDDADMDLLLGISIQNGGRTVRIYEGYGDAASQMERFYRQELGTVFLTDIHLSYGSDTHSVKEATLSDVPLLAGGSEVVVRGKWDIPTVESFSARQAGSSSMIRAVVDANSASGPVTWSKEFTVELEEPQIGVAAARECHQSYAQARIIQLLEYRDAERALGSDLLDGLSEYLPVDSDFKQLARNLALDAGLVWPGLTALVTVESESCETSYDVCYDGEGTSYGGDLSFNMGDDENIAPNSAAPSPPASPPPILWGTHILNVPACVLMTPITIGLFFLE